MQVAQILWNLLAHGGLDRLYQWARDATARGLARSIWEALQADRLPPDLPPLGQIRFGSDGSFGTESSQPDPVETF